MYNTDQAGNAETLKNGLEQKLKAVAVYMGQGDSLEAVVDLAIYGLFAMGKVHQKTGKEQIILQLAAGHLRNIFAAFTPPVRIPTIGANEYKGSGQARYRGSPEYRGAKASEGLRTSSADPIYLTPSFAEWMMNFPIGSSGLKQLATDKTQS